VYSVGAERRHKGLKSILVDRGLWRDASVDRKKMSRDEAVAVLSAEPDFKAFEGQSWLEEVCADLTVNLGLDISCVYGVKFHPELSAIEYYWGECKRFTRSTCDYTIKTLKSTVPIALKLVGALSGDDTTKQKRLGTIRRHFAHVERYMDAYALGILTPAQIEWCMHSYTSHRRTKECQEDPDGVEKLNKNWLSEETRAKMEPHIKNEAVTVESDDEIGIGIDEPAGFADDE
jgi:hypothetical protein